MSNETKHSPAPWIFRANADHLNIISGIRVVAYVPNGLTDAQTEADRILIAAAPELLALVKTLRDALRDVVRQLPHDERLADYSLDFAEHADLEALKMLIRFL